MSLLHRKHAFVKQVVLCSRMDLIGVLYTDGMLSVYRTISWEKISSIKFTEDVECRPDGDFVAKFSPSGNTLTIASRSAAILDITLNRFSQVGEDLPEDLFYVDIDWIEGSLPSAVQGQSEFTLKNNATPVEKGYLLAATNDYNIIVYQYGIIPVQHFSVSPEGLRNIFQPQTELFRDDSLFTLTSHDHVSEKRYIVFNHSDLLQHSTMANSIFHLKALIQSIRDSQNNMSKRWREALRVFPPKVELMNSALRGYELNNGIVDFLHSIVLCGLWHPAASVIFSQHWNEQSLSRLRSAVDSTLKYIERTLQLQIIPSIESMIMLAKEAIGSVSSSWVHKEKWENFASQCHCLLQSSDKLLHEVFRVSLISQKVLLFFRSCMIEAGGATTTTATYCALNPDDRKLLEEVLASERNVPSSNPEYLFGTSLLQLLSPDIPRSTSSTVGQTSMNAADSPLDQAFQAVIQLDPVPHFARQLKMVVDAHDKLQVVYEPLLTNPIVKVDAMIDELIESIAGGAEILSRDQSVLEKSETGEPTVVLSAFFLQRTDKLGLTSYELFTWRESYSTESCEFYRARVPELCDDLNDIVEPSEIWSKLFITKTGGIRLLVQDVNDTESVLMFNVTEDDIEYTDDFDAVKRKSGLPILSVGARLPTSGAKVSKAVYNEARGILAMICPNSLLVFDANATDEEEEKEEDAEEGEEEAENGDSNSAMDDVDNDSDL